VTIEASWISMRTNWSALGTTDHDGVKTWDTSLLDLGFTGANITCTRQVGGIIYDFTVAAACDWYVSQRADWFDASEPAALTLRLVVSTAGLAATVPDGMNAANRRRLFRGLYIYAKRQSDDAIAVFDCERVGLDDLATSTSMTGAV